VFPYDSRQKKKKIARKKTVFLSPVGQSRGAARVLFLGWTWESGIEEFLIGLLNAVMIRARNAFLLAVCHQPTGQTTSKFSIFFYKIGLKHLKKSTVKTLWSVKTQTQFKNQARGNLSVATAAENFFQWFRDGLHMGQETNGLTPGRTTESKATEAFELS